MNKPTRKRSLSDTEKAECEALNAIYKAKKKALGLSQEKIAIEGLGANSQSAASHYLTGRNALNIEAAAIFARYLQEPVSAFSPRLAREIEELSRGSISNVEMALQPTRSFMYPEISWVQAGAATEAMETSNVAACERHSSDVWAGEDGFWLKVVGQSMTSPVGASFPEGSLILVAPEIEPNSGQLVVARMPDKNEATFKQFLRDAGEFYLKPLNPSFPTTPMDDEWEVVGTVVDGKMPKSIFR